DWRSEEEGILEQEGLDPGSGGGGVLEAFVDVALSPSIDQGLHPTDTRRDALQLARRETLFAELDALHADTALLEPPLGLACLGALLLAEDLDDAAAHRRSVPQHRSTRGPPKVRGDP